MPIYDDIFAKSSVGGRYKVLKRLGGGAFGEVFLADQEVAGVPGIKFRQVALKLFTRDYVSAANASTVFAEAMLLEQLAQATRARGEPVHLVTIYDIGVLRDYDGVPYVAMERLHSSLAAELAQSQIEMPLDRAIIHMRGICAGVRLAHQHSPAYIHRDLKPDNVLIEQNGFLKVADFGLAIDRYAAFRHNGAGGTISYSPPECRKGGVPTPAFDVYSMGVIFLELLTRRNPLAEALGDADPDQSELILSHAQACLAELKDPATGELISARLTELRNAPAVLAVLRRCLALEPGGRFRNVMELDAALADIETGRMPVSSEPPKDVETGRQRLDRIATEAETLIEAGQLAEAAVRVAEVCHFAPHHQRGQFLLAKLRKREGKLEDAIKAQKAGIKLVENGRERLAPDLVEELIRLYKAAGKPSAADALQSDLDRRGGR